MFLSFPFPSIWNQLKNNTFTHVFPSSDLLFPEKSVSVLPSQHVHYNGNWNVIYVYILSISQTCDLPLLICSSSYLCTVNGNLSSLSSSRKIPWYYPNFITFPHSRSNPATSLDGLPFKVYPETFKVYPHSPQPPWSTQLTCFPGLAYHLYLFWALFSYILHSVQLKYTF